MPSIEHGGKNIPLDAKNATNPPPDLPPASPLYIQEKIPSGDLDAVSGKSVVPGNNVHCAETGSRQSNLFPEFNEVSSEAEKTAFYRHGQNWKNRMILGDALQVMGSLTQRESLARQVQAIYLQPPYGKKFNSKFKWSSTSPDLINGSPNDFTVQAEQVSAFRTVWREGLRSWLSFLRRRFLAARELLGESGSIFVPIGDENVHHVRLLLEKIFGETNYVSQISFITTPGFSGSPLASELSHVLWFAKNIDQLKYRQLYIKKVGDDTGDYMPQSSILQDFVVGSDRLARLEPLTTQSAPTRNTETFSSHSQDWRPPEGLSWKTTPAGLERLDKAGRIVIEGGIPKYLSFLDDFPVLPRTSFWNDMGTPKRGINSKIHLERTSPDAAARCILMSTDPGDLVLDFACGSGSAALAAEQWGRRWITIDSSRVALALTRSRLIGARFPWYLLADSPAGAAKEAELQKIVPAPGPFSENIRAGFVYERAPRITLKAIAGNARIDGIWASWQKTLQPLQEELNKLLKKSWDEWEIPLVAADVWPEEGCRLHSTLAKAYRVKMPDNKTRPLLQRLNEILGSRYKKIEHLPQKPETAWPEKAAKIHALWLEARKKRQLEIDEAIAAGTHQEFLFDKPFADKKTARVAGPFTVESFSQPRVPIAGKNAGTPETVAQPGINVPDIEILPEKNSADLRVKIPGMAGGSSDRRGHSAGKSAEIACWLLDTDYNGKIFFARQAFFPGGDDTCQALKTTLNAEIDPEVCLAFTSAVSRPFPRPKSGRIAVQAINHMGEVGFKVCGV